MKKLTIYFCRLLKKEKPTLNQRAEFLFKAFEHITEDCSPISQARVFNLFKEELERHFIENQSLMIVESRKCVAKASNYKTAYENIKK